MKRYKHARPDKAVKRTVRTLPRPLTFFYEIFPGEIRWWCNQNPGDVFDIISKEELAIRIKGAEMCQIRVVDHLPGFCDLMEKCPDHLGYY